MPLNLPIYDQLAGCRSILIAGMGGGYDVFCGLPLYLELRALGKTVHLASFSFATVRWLRRGERLSETLIGVTGEHARLLGQVNDLYFPELFLAEWLAHRFAENIPVWSLEKSGALPLLANYRLLVEHLGVDAMVLVDGGVDSLIRGDESELGTVVHDALSLAAVSALEQVPVRIVGCLGMGAEREVPHYEVLQNIADLTADGAFLGACSLSPQFASCREYDEAVAFAHERHPAHASIINTSILSALRGGYGNVHYTSKTHGSQLWISPLMPLFWFFELIGVAERNLLLSVVRNTETFSEALQAIFTYRSRCAKRAAQRIPLP